MCGCTTFTVIVGGMWGDSRVLVVNSEAINLFLLCSAVWFIGGVVDIVSVLSPTSN